MSVPLAPVATTASVSCASLTRSRKKKPKPSANSWRTPVADKRATKTLKNKADRLFSLLIRSRGVCERCGKRPPEVMLQCAHVFSRSYTAIRWDERNALCLCRGCHHWGHMRPVEWTLFIEETIGADTVRVLLEKARNYAGRVKRVDYEELIAELESKVAA